MCVFVRGFVCVHDHLSLSLPQGFSISFICFWFVPPPPPILFLWAGRAYIGFNIIFQSASTRGHGLWTPVCFPSNTKRKNRGKERVQIHKAFKRIICNNCAGILRLMCSLLFCTWDSWLYKLSASHRLFPDKKHHLPGFINAQRLSSILTTYVHLTLLSAPQRKPVTYPPAPKLRHTSLLIFKSCCDRNGRNVSDWTRP